MSFDNQNHTPFVYPTAAAAAAAAPVSAASPLGPVDTRARENTATTASLDHDPRPVVSYDAYYTSQAAAVPVQYNEAGYALSTNYNPPKPAEDASSTSIKPKIPPPLIQGTNISLDTPEDIAKWIAERKKKWPTPANVEKNNIEKSRLAAQRPAAKKRKMQHKKIQDRPQDSGTTTLSSQKRSDVETTNPSEILDVGVVVQRVEKDKVEQETQGVSASSLDVALAALTGTIEAETSPPKINEAEDAEAMTGPVKALDDQSGSDGSSGDSTSSGSSSDSDSSGSDSDQDDAPEPVSSKIVAETKEEPVSSRPRRVCKYFRQGRCTRGDDCTFGHILARPRNDGKTSNATRGPAKMDDKQKWRKRKSLYERLVEGELAKEQEEEKARLAAVQENMNQGTDGIGSEVTHFNETA